MILRMKVRPAPDGFRNLSAESGGGRQLLNNVDVSSRTSFAAAEFARFTEPRLRLGGFAGRFAAGWAASSLASCLPKHGSASSIPCCNAASPRRSETAAEAVAQQSRDQHVQTRDLGLRLAQQVLQHRRIVGQRR
jgi:hypothetical protein